MGSDVPYFSSHCEQISQWYDLFWKACLNHCILREIYNIALQVIRATDIGVYNFQKCYCWIDWTLHSVMESVSAETGYEQFPIMSNSS